MALPDMTGTVTIVAPTLTDGLGGTAVLNTPGTNFVGYLAETSGFDGPSVRTSMDDVPEGHGATFGSFYYGPRSFTLEVSMVADTTWTLSNTRLDKLLRATNAMAADGTISWAESGITKHMNFRREQPPRGPSSDRRILISGIAADPRIYAAEQSTTTLTSVTNAGNASTPPRFTLSAPSNPTFTNTTTGKVFSMTISGGGTLTVDFANHTATQGGVSRYSSVNFTTSEWWELAPGLNNITVSGGGTNTIYWSSAWI
jgi:hypothetical protein